MPGWKLLNTDLPAAGRAQKQCTVRASGGDYHSWRKKAFGSKPNLPGSTRSPQQQDPIDKEWQVRVLEFAHLPSLRSGCLSFQISYSALQALQRGRNDTPSNAGPLSTSGRADASNNYGYSVEDSWDIADDAYTPFPSKAGPSAAGDSVVLDNWSAGSLNMAASSELWNRVTQVSADKACFWHLSTGQNRKTHWSLRPAGVCDPVWRRQDRHGRHLFPAGGDRK